MSWGVCAVGQERLFDQSDAYRVHVCEKCGLIAVANLKKNQYYCPACKNSNGIVQVSHITLDAPTDRYCLLVQIIPFTCTQTVGKTSSWTIAIHMVLVAFTDVA